MCRCVDVWRVRGEGWQGNAIAGSQAAHADRGHHDPVAPRDGCESLVESVQRESVRCVRACERFLVLFMHIGIGMERRDSMQKRIEELQLFLKESCGLTSDCDSRYRNI